jgi:hypothetical protein
MNDRPQRATTFRGVKGDRDLSLLGDVGGDELRSGSEFTSDSRPARRRQVDDDDIRPKEPLHCREAQAGRAPRDDR